MQLWLFMDCNEKLVTENLMFQQLAVNLSPVKSLTAISSFSRLLEFQEKVLA